MKQSQTRIGEIIICHYALLNAYDKILGALESNNTIEVMKLEIKNPRKILGNKDLSFFEKLQLIGHYFSFINNNQFLWAFFSSLFKKILKKKPTSTPSSLYDKQYSINGLVMYFMKTHIRRQLSALHKLYQRELVFRTTISDSANTEQLRNITLDIKNYIQDLPNINKFFVVITPIIFGILAFLQLIGLNIPFSQISFAEMIGYTILGLLFVYAIVLIVSMPFMDAFKVKRVWLLNSRSYYHANDHYFGEGSKIYESSIYSKEDELFGKLGAKNRKPNEIPIGIILRMIIGGGVFTLISSLFAVAVFSEWEVIQQNSAEWVIVIFIMIIGGFGFRFLIEPIIEYLRRKKNHLL